jgi:hypothetical protein
MTCAASLWASLVWDSPAVAAESEIVPVAPEVKGPGKAAPGEGTGLHYFRFGGKYGYVTADGGMAIPPEFATADNFSPRGVARAGDGKGAGLIDARGDWVVLPLLKAVEPDGGEGAGAYLAVFYGWHGLIAPDGAWLAPPRFQRLEPLGHGYFSYRFRGKAGLVGPDGSFVTQPFYEKLGQLAARPDGSYLLAFTYEGKEGLMDQTGKVVISPRFEYISPGFDGNGRYVMQVDGKYGVLDISDRWIIEPKYFLIEWKEKEGRFWVQEGLLASSYFYHDRDGKRTGPIPQADIWAAVGDKPFGLTGCFAAGGAQDVFGFCDKEAKEQIKPQWDRVWDFSREAGLARVMRSGRYGYVDPKGAEAVPVQYEEAYDYGPDRRAVVMKSGGWGVLDETGRAVIEPNLEAYPSPAGDGAYFAKKGGRWGILDRDGKTVLGFELEEALPFREATGLAWARKGGLWGMIDHSGKWTLDPVYEEIGPFTEAGLAPAVLGGRFAVVDGRGDPVARSVVECGREAVRDRSGAVSWPPDFNCPG